MAMRLICPNCGAQYEIDAELIPQAGRDVQCSDCGHTWFETPGASLAREASIDDLATPDDLPEDGATSQAEAAFTDQPPSPEAPRPHLSEDVAQILREEADHERAQRKRDAEQIEIQPDLGLHDAPARREQLPDIEEINSSLRSNDAPPTPPAAPTRKGGFWTGFLIIVLLAALALAAYLFADQIARALPATDPALSAYTDWVDGLRLRLFEIVETVKAPK